MYNIWFWFGTIFGFSHAKISSKCEPYLYTLPNPDYSTFESYSTRISHINSSIANHQSIYWPKCSGAYRHYDIVTGQETIIGSLNDSECYVLTHNSYKSVCACTKNYTWLTVVNDQFTPSFYGDNYTITSDYIYKNNTCTQNETLILKPFVFNTTNCTISIPEKERFNYDYSMNIANALNGTISEIEVDLDECSHGKKKEGINIKLLCSGVGSALFIMLIALIVYYCYRKTKRKQVGIQAKFTKLDEMTPKK
eukprot:733258_1